MELDTAIDRTENFTMEDARRRIEQRRAARLRRQRRRWIFLTASGMIAASCLGFFLGTTTRSREPTPSAPEFSWAAIITEGLESTAAPEQIANEVQESSAQDLWSNDRSRIEIQLLSAPLDSETQWAIYSLCDYDDSLFCAVMAIAQVESRFKTDAVSDSGDSIGMMQINTRWHTDRMEALGVTDLTNPVQCVAVAISYLKELGRTFGVWTDSHILYMAYNMGPTGARNALQSGATSSSYSRAVMAVYEQYMVEIGGQT